MHRFNALRQEIVSQVLYAFTPGRSYTYFYLILIGGVLATLLITLYPFRFEQFSRIFTFYQYFDGFSSTGYSRCCKYLIYLEPLANIIMFVPFGFGLTGRIKRRGNLLIKPLFLVLLLSFLFSFTIEFLQVFQPTRSPSLLDLAMNTTGGGLGYWGYRLFKRLFPQKRNRANQSPVKRNRTSQSSLKSKPASTSKLKVRR